MKISLLTGCRDRVEHLLETLPYNIKLLEAHPDLFEIIVVDYGSQEPLIETLRPLFQDFIKKQVLKIYRVEPFPPRYCHGKVKNLGYKLATGDLAINVDADIGISLDFELITELHALSSNRKFCLTSWDDTDKKKPYGITGFWRNDFINTLQGFNEEMIYGWGYEDKDIINRAKKLGFLFYRAIKIVKWIEHPNSTRHAHTQLKIKESREKHKQIADLRWTLGKFNGNDGPWGLQPATQQF